MIMIIVCAIVQPRHGDDDALLPDSTMYFNLAEDLWCLLSGAKEVCTLTPSTGAERETMIGDNLIQDISERPPEISNRSVVGIAVVRMVAA
jgi:hypothetical protein